MAQMKEAVDRVKRRRNVPLNDISMSQIFLSEIMAPQLKDVKLLNMADVVDLNTGFWRKNDLFNTNKIPLTIPGVGWP